MAKLAFLRQLGAPEWDLSDLNPNRRKFLAQVGRRSTSQTLQRMPDHRRYPILVVLLHETTLDLVDEIVDLFKSSAEEDRLPLATGARGLASRDRSGHQREGPLVLTSGTSRSRPGHPGRAAASTHLRGGRFPRTLRGRRKEGVAVLLKGLVRSKTLLDNWDELLRVADSLKLGWVTASLLISKLQTGARENVLSRALRDLGRLVKTQFILRGIENPDYRRRIHRQLNQGEALHALRRFLFFAHEGKVQRRQADQQTNQVLCLNLVTNAIVTWNTVYRSLMCTRRLTGSCRKRGTRSSMEW